MKRSLEAESDNNMNLLPIILLLIAFAAAIIAIFFFHSLFSCRNLTKSAFCRKNPICAQTCNSFLPKRYTLTKLDATQLLIHYIHFIHYIYCGSQKLNR